MRRIGSVLPAGVVAVGMAVVVSVFAVSAGALQSRGGVENADRAQYYGEDHAPAPPAQDAAPTPLPEVPPARSEVEARDTDYYAFYARWLTGEGDIPGVSEAEGSSAGGAPSEGSAPGARAPADALSVMEPPVPYSQVVDDASPERFYSARGWKKASRQGSGRSPRHGAGHRYTRPSEDAPPAWFRVKIPAAGYYTVYARWPAAKGNNRATRFQISTASGPEKVEVNQRKDGGVWVRLGAYEMEAGDRYSVRVGGHSKARGRMVADAVRVVGGTQAPPRTQAGRSGVAREPAVGGQAPGGAIAGAEVVERARTHLGTPYRHSPPLPCEAYRSEDCSCLTSLVFGKWLTMPDDPVEQWNAGRRVEQSDLRPGDLVFFKEAGEGYPITHVAIYSGSGNIIHASTYWGQVVERPMRYVHGYYGARRLS